MNKTNIKFCTILVFFLVIIQSFLFISCAKKREAKIPESEALELIEISKILSNSSFSTTLLNNTQRYNASGEKIFRIDPQGTPAIYSGVFDEMFVVGAMDHRPHQGLHFKVKLKEEGVLAFYKFFPENDKSLLSQSEKALLEISAEGEKVALLFYYNIEYKRLQIHKDEQGHETTQYDILSSDLAHATHVKVNFHTKRPIFATSDLTWLKDAYENKIQLSEYNQEMFYFIRTLLDVPYSFTHLFTGLNSNLELVQFDFKRKTLDIKRLVSPIELKEKHFIDEEILLSLPVDYYRKIYVDEKGLQLVNPIFSKIDFDPKSLTFEALKKENIEVYIHWNEAEIDSTKGSLGFYFEKCFSKKADPVVFNEMKKEKGSLSFSLTETYIQPTDLCLDKNEQPDKSFTFKTRFSFKPFKGDLKKEKPLFSIPLFAQKKMGFGLFSYERDLQDSKGHLKTKESKQFYSAVHNLAKDEQGHFRVLKYVLTGLPLSEAREDIKIRGLVIRATKKVIQDLNEGFRRAFLGTEMQGSPGEEVLELFIEGISEKEAKTYDVKKYEGSQLYIGDLDINKIVYLPRVASVGLLGMAPSNPSPLSGEIINSNVYMYGGNLIKSIHSLKKVKKIADDYYKRMNVKPFQFSTPDSDPVPIPVGVASSSNRNFMEPTHSMTANLMMKSLGASEDEASWKVKFDQVLRQYSTLSHQNNFDVKSILMGEIDENGKFNRNKSYQFFEEIQKDLAARGFCLKDTESLLNSSWSGLGSGKSIYLDESKTDDDRFEAIYTSTLAHELVHTLGIRHNFLGKFDKKHFFFDDEEKTEHKRDYSSIMDYSSTVDDSYQGLGPQDVYTLKTVYSHFMNTNKREKDLLNTLGIETWYDLKDTMDISKIIPYLRSDDKFLFCTDDDQRNDLRCRKFIKGSSYSEIVYHKILNYKSLYKYHNFQHERSDFKLRKEINSYIANLFQSFSYLNEFMLEYMSNKNTNDDLKNAAKLVHDFFIEVVRTPTSIPKDLDPSIFPFPIQEKELYSIKFDESQKERLDLIGIEWDKLIALEFLCKSFILKDEYRPQTRDLLISYYNLEKILSPHPDKFNMEESELLQLLKEIFSGHLRPALYQFQENEKRGRFIFTPFLKAKISNRMKAFALSGLYYDLQRTTFPTYQDPVNLFRVYRGNGELSIVDGGKSPYSVFPSSPAAYSLFLKYKVNTSLLAELEKQLPDGTWKSLERVTLNVIYDFFYDWLNATTLEEKKRNEVELTRIIMGSPEEFFRKYRLDKDHLDYDKIKAKLDEILKSDKKLINNDLFEDSFDAILYDLAMNYLNGNSKEEMKVIFEMRRKKILAKNEKLLISIKKMSHYYYISNPFDH